MNKIPGAQGAVAAVGWEQKSARVAAHRQAPCSRVRYCKLPSEGQQYLAGYIRLLLHLRIFEVGKHHASC